LFFFFAKTKFFATIKEIFIKTLNFMVRYNNKYEKRERKKLQNRNKKTEIQTGKIAFNSDPWEEKEYKNLT
jgi:hypothetical protein